MNSEIADQLRKLADTVLQVAENITKMEAPPTKPKLSPTVKVKYSPWNDRLAYFDDKTVTASVDGLDAENIDKAVNFAVGKVVSDFCKSGDLDVFPEITLEVFDGDKVVYTRNATLKAKVFNLDTESLADYKSKIATLFGGNKDG